MNLVNPFRRTNAGDELTVPKTAVVQRRAIETEVQAVLANFADLREERDRAMKLVTDARDHIVELKKEIADLQNHTMRQDEKIVRLQEEVTDANSRTTVYQLERDGAVAKFAERDSLLKSLKAMLDAHGVVGYEREPIAPDAEAPEFKEPPTHDDMRKLVARIDARD